MKTRAFDMRPIHVLIPVFNDWTSLEHLLGRLSRELRGSRHPISVLIVDDASDEHAHEALRNVPFDAFEEVRVLRLRRNLGHQRAIAVGLSFLEASSPGKAVVVMDGDGEDRPEDVPRLIEACDAAGFHSIVFAERSKRSESITFRIGYHIFRALHVILTGRRMSVGNFSIIPFESLQSLVTVSELWNHYPAAADKSRQPRTTIPTSRGRRFAGGSRLNLESLVIHGLSAIAVHADVIGVRAILLSSLLLLLTIAAGLTVFAVRAFTQLAIPGWATSAGGLLLVLFVQLLTLAAVFSFITLSNRHGTAVIPRRDYEIYILSVEELRPDFSEFPRPSSVENAGDVSLLTGRSEIDGRYGNG